MEDIAERSRRVRVSSGLSWVYNGAKFFISFTWCEKSLSIYAVRAEEQVPFIFLMILILILLRPLDVFLRICL